MKVFQDIKILQQLLKEAGNRGDSVTVNIVSIENNCGHSESDKDSKSLSLEFSGTNSGVLENKPCKSRCLLPRSGLPAKEIQFFDIDIDYDILFNLIDKLSTPRLDVLMYSIFKMCADRGMTRQETADWLGMAFSTASNWFNRFGLKPLRKPKKVKERVCQ